MNNDFVNLFSPRGIAVVGVSNDPNKLGSVIFNNIVHEEYKGAIYPVNPKYPEVYGKKCYAKISDIQGDLDIVVIVTPAQTIMDIMQECAVKKVGYVIIVSSGFKEIGPEGAKLENELTQFARANGIRIVGPNCLGVIFTDSSLNASFAAQMPKAGNIAFLSQSGAFNTALLDIAASRNLGFKYFISLGNKSDINENDLLTVWLGNSETRVIGAYIEEFDDGRKFVEIAQQVADKPILLLHPGESEAGQHAVASHTGSLAGSSRTIKTSLKQAGVIQVDSVEKMFNCLKIFSWSPLPKGNRVAIITNAGGPGIILTDLLEKSSLKLAQLSDESKAKLKEVLPPHASVENPVDILGDALAVRYKSAVEILLQDPGVDSILLLLTPQLVTQIEETAKLAINFFQTSYKPIIPVFMGDKYVTAGLERMWENEVPAYKHSEDAVYSLDMLTRYSLESTTQKTSINIDVLEGATAQYKDEVVQYAQGVTTALPSKLASVLAASVGMDLPKESSITTIDEAKAFAAQNGYPVVLKADSADIAHKTDANLLHLGIRDEQALSLAFESLRSQISELTKRENPSILIQEMLKADEELILGTIRDKSLNNERSKSFGTLLLFGKGGIYTEVFKDSSTRLMNASREEIVRMIDETKVSKILHGARGKAPLAIDKVVDTLWKLQKLVQLYPEIESIDINPAMVTANRCVAIDVKIFVSKLT